MKTIKTITLIFLFSSFWTIGVAQGEVKGTKQKLEFNIDELGDAEIVLNMKLNASQWDIFRKTVGNNPASLKGEIIKGLPTVYLTDFKYEEDPMERSYNIRMKGLAAVQQNKNGKWEAELDMKNPEIIKLNDLQFRLDLNLLNNGLFIEQTQLINLPKNAKNAKIETDSFGYAILTYETKNGLGGIMRKSLGILLIIGGAFTGIKQLRRGNQAA